MIFKWALSEQYQASDTKKMMQHKKSAENHQIFLLK